MEGGGVEVGASPTILGADVALLESGIGGFARVGEVVDEVICFLYKGVGGGSIEGLLHFPPRIYLGVKDGKLGVVGIESMRGEG